LLVGQFGSYPPLTRRRSSTIFASRRAIGCMLSKGSEGQYAISINEKWRICFRFENGDAHEVEVCDYH
jgi:hypothetical protein